MVLEVGREEAAEAANVALEGVGVALDGGDAGAEAGGFILPLGEIVAEGENHLEGGGLDRRVEVDAGEQGSPLSAPFRFLVAQGV